MRIKCQGCRDTFDVPDGKGVTSAICPFCDKPNNLRSPHDDSATHPNSHSLRAKEPTFMPNKSPPHPLAPQFWILSICALILTVLIVVSALLTVIAIAQTNVNMQNDAKLFKDAMDKASNKVQRSLQKPLKP